MSATNTVLLANSHASLGGADLDPAAATRPVHHVRTPKALLPSPLHTLALDVWWQAMRDESSSTYLVTNAAYFKHFERWATASDFPVDHIINDGTTDAADALSVAASLALVMRRIGLTDSSHNLVVAAVESHPNAIAAVEIGRWFAAERSDVCASTDAGLRTGSAGDFEIVGLRLRGQRLALVRTHEAALSTRSCLRTFYGALANYAPSTPADGLTIEYTDLSPAATVTSLEEEDDVAATTPNAGGPLVAAYHKWFASEGVTPPSAGVGPNVPEPIVTRANARVGVMGNPSDGFFGRTISLSVNNFWAEVRVWPSTRLAILPHPLYDPLSFGSLADLHKVVAHEGTDGGVRLLLAACKRFYSHCQTNGIDLRTDANCTLAYDTNVPRQVGLAGSSAILTATITSLIAFHRVPKEKLPLDELPSLVLSIEKVRCPPLRPSRTSPCEPAAAPLSIRAMTARGPLSPTRTGGAGHQRRAAGPRDPGIWRDSLHGL